MVQLVGALPAFVTLAADKQKAGGEGATVAGNALVDPVGNMVGQIAQLRVGAGGTGGQYLLLGGNVVQGVVELDALIRQAAGIANHQVLGTNCAPVTKDDFFGKGRHADKVFALNRGEQARVAQIVADNHGGILCQFHAAGGEGHHGNGHGAIH